MPDFISSAPVFHPDVESVLVARRHVRIVHHVPGRVRLRFEPLPLMAAFGGRIDALKAALARIRGIRGIEVNLAACSLVVQYDPAALPPAQWDRLLTADAAAAVALLDSLLAPA